MDLSESYINRLKNLAGIKVLNENLPPQTQSQTNPQQQQTSQQQPAKQQNSFKSFSTSNPQEKNNQQLNTNLTLTNYGRQLYDYFKKMGYSPILQTQKGVLGKYEMGKSSVSINTTNDMLRLSINGLQTAEQAQESLQYLTTNIPKTFKGLKIAQNGKIIQSFAKGFTIENIVFKAETGITENI